nr:hypothetical protein [Tanacetum cinerariifolium]
KITIAQNKLMEQLTSMCAMVGQLIQKKQEEKQIEEEQAANARFGRFPLAVMMTMILQSHQMNPLTLSVWGMSILTLFRQRNQMNS